MEAMEAKHPTSSTQPRLFCRKCGYPLIGLTTSTCPECGNPFDLQNPRTFSRRPPRDWMQRWLLRVKILLLGLVAFAALGFGWLGRGWHAEQKTIARLNDLKAKVMVQSIGPEELTRVLGQRFGYLRDRTDEVYLFNRRSPEIEGLDLSALGRLETLTLFACDLNDAILDKLGELTTLQKLVLRPTKFNKLSFKFLTKLKRLNRLSLSGARIDDDAVINISTLKRLKFLDLGSTGVTDACLEHLRALPVLETLDLTYTPCTDAGLEHLSNLKSLYLLVVAHTRTTLAGIAKLRAAIPGLIVRQ
jgi:hypothetical protein